MQGELLFGGDLYPDGPIRLKLRRSPEDILVANGEFARGPILKQNKVLLTTDYDFASRVPDGRLVLTLANNHILDAGGANLESYLNYLDTHGIAHAGAGPLPGCGNPLILAHGSGPVALIAFQALGRTFEDSGYAAAAFGREQVLRVLSAARAQTDHIIACMHWGSEQSPLVTKTMRQAAHFLIDQGCSMVIGHHPHCIGPAEIYRGRPIFYSLGHLFVPDFAAPAYFREDQPDGITYRVRQASWNHRGLIVCYDPAARTVREVRLAVTKGRCVCDGGAVRVPEQIPAARFKSLTRKIRIALSGNVLAGGKIVDTDFIRNEIRIRMH